MSVLQSREGACLVVRPQDWHASLLGSIPSPALGLEPDPKANGHCLSGLRPWLGDSGCLRPCNELLCPPQVAAEPYTDDEPATAFANGARSFSSGSSDLCFKVPGSNRRCQ